MPKLKQSSRRQVRPPTTRPNNRQHASYPSTQAAKDATLLKNYKTYTDKAKFTGWFAKEHNKPRTWTTARNKKDFEKYVEWLGYDNANTARQRKRELKGKAVSDTASQRIL